MWGDFKHTDFGKIILPFTLLRRLGRVLGRGVNLEGW
nr:type I restriction-modification system subunit M N-terminal domain-containing protein [Candidatus Erwinia dacicola]